jgi:hypothetical protein
MRTEILILRGMFVTIESGTTPIIYIGEQNSGREEKHFIIPISKKDDLLRLVQNRGVADQHSDMNATYQIISNYLMVWSSSEAKGKIRLRQYVASGVCSYFLENKYRIAGNGFKKRVQLDFAQYNEILSMSCCEDIIQWMRKRSSEVFSIPITEYSDFNFTYVGIGLTYARICYEFRYCNHNYRFTLDSDLRVIGAESDFAYLFDGTQCIVELKGKEIDDAVVALFDLDRVGQKSKLSKYKMLLAFLGKDGKTS